MRRIAARCISLAALADDAVANDLGRYRDANARLADPRSCDETCMTDALEWARPIYYLNGGLNWNDLPEPPANPPIIQSAATPTSGANGVTE